jgi:TonB family protein
VSPGDPTTTRRNTDGTLSVRRTRGLVVVIVLGVIFFALLGLIIVNSGRRTAPPALQAETLSVVPLHVRLRTEPNAKAPVVATEEQGQKLIVLEDRGPWVRVQDSDNLVGWAERNSLERTSERARRMARYEAIRKLPALAGIVTERAPLYGGPGIFYPVIGELTAETQVKIFTRDHDFYAIDHDGQIAYADVDAIDVSAAGRQLDVHTETTPATDTTTPSVPPAEATASMPPASQTEPQPALVAPPTTAAPGNQTSVYAAVPPGGTQPEEVDRVVPRYPIMARRANVAGAVVVRGIVRRDGTIDNVEIIKDLPDGLGEAAREAVQQWRFRAATYRGEPIDVYYTVTVNFRLSP